MEKEKTDISRNTLRKILIFYVKVGKFKVWAVMFSLDIVSDILFLSFQKKHILLSFGNLYWIQSNKHIL